MFSICEPTYRKKPARPYYDPVWPYGEPMMPALDALSGMNGNRLGDRRSLLTQLDDRFEQLQSSRAIDRLDGFQERAFSMLVSSKTRDAFDLSREPTPLRERYGRNLFGQSMMVARRLVESDVPFVSVHAENFLPNGSFTYDMHANNFGLLRDYNLPVLDRCFTALVEDLEQRGLLDSTLIVVMGEMGRSPKINAKAGRDHWPQAQSILVAGGGYRAGQVIGATNSKAEHPISRKVGVADFCRIVYHGIGLTGEEEIVDPGGRPVHLVYGGKVPRELL